MIYLIITTSINNKVGINNEIHRKNRYIDSIQQLLTFVESDPSIKPVIVENNGQRSTYLDDLHCDVLYTDNNKTDFIHKGQNELLDIKAVIHHYRIRDDDMIIKITGRYKLISHSFINRVKDNLHHYDVFIKFFNVCAKEYLYNDCVLGLFAVKCKYIKNFNYQLKTGPECEFANYIRTYIPPNKLVEVTQLDLECCFADDLRLLVV